MPYTWDDAADIADALAEGYPDTDPLSVSFPRLHRMIVALAEFVDDPNAANERRLEAIQMAWHDLVSD